ncbi:non-hydrolyzing UDP-N-acetylglucosamine 2-epimerase [Halobacillus sp. Marseille-Q1614]|uniref:non-hydrolyzing UDP-N-acetylglucosamine 2-epimerase n=1 Tax=Halobacillus sp. Marseille-Q1614 TaxID=2709134 RepID=UPI00156F6B6C|nr:UDP-N-acetylglucosamine 2-epimerase (non-hydrolyzing) [Halobacillus sp. Marseille-Q1614]
MANRLKVMTIFGTRPEAIKMAPLVLELKKRPEQFEPIVAVTAQHRQMLDQVLNIFNIEPDFDLNIMKDRQTLAQVTTRALEGLDNVMKEAEPDIVLVHGDTTTTFSASLAAYYNQIPVGHVEAGLRTWNKYSPFPEEMNRQLTGVMADLHFSPTNKSRDNLLEENKPAESIFVTGNTAIDALKTTVDEAYQSDVLDSLDGRRLVLMTAHRRENLGNNMKQMFRAIKRLVETHDDIEVVYPVHLNPVVRETADEILGNDDRIKLIDPLDVIDFHNFASRAHLILTDSGGVQEEAPSLGVPVLVLRDTTERPEGIEAGTLMLAGTDEDHIYNLAHELLSDDEKHAAMAHASNPYGDGQASARIAEAIRYYFNHREDKPEHFETE